MSDQYIGEIRYFPYLRGAPSGWLQCSGQLVGINQYEVLYAVLGTTYGGDGSSTFGLPDLRGRVPVGAIPGTYPLGSISGQEAVSLTTANLPSHTHAIQASANAATSTTPSGQVFAAGQGLYYTPATASPQAMSPTAIGLTGNGLAHDNCAPTLPIVACIAWDGIFPPQN